MELYGFMEREKKIPSYFFIITYARKKGVHEVMKKLRAHPLCVSVYVVYYACVARTFILVSLLCVCVCVCVFTQLFGLTK